MKKKQELEAPEFLSVPQAAKLCGLSRNTVYSWVRKGKMDAYQTPGKTNLIRPSELEKFMIRNGMFVPPALAQLARKDERLGGEMKSTSSGSRCAVLVVDDEPTIRQLTMDMLGDSYALYQAATGYEALHLLTMRNDIQIVLLDINMPGQKGYETIREASHNRPDVAIIVVTGYASEIPEEVRTMPIVRNILEKPVDYQMLRKCVDGVAAGFAA